MTERAATPLQLRALQRRDAGAFAELLGQLPGDTPTFLHGHHAGMQFDDYLAHLELRRTNAFVHDPGQVPESLLFAFAGETIAGRVSIRHRLTPALAELAGHIGYAVLPPWRGRGLATAMLRDALGFAHGPLGIGTVIVTCDQTNAASRRVIEKNGGHHLGDVALPGGAIKRRYAFARR